MRTGVAAGTLIGLLAAPLIAAAQQPQAVKPPASSAPTAPPEAPGNSTVIRPPAHIDPGIKAPAPKAKLFPMPVIKPPVAQMPSKPER